METKFKVQILRKLELHLTSINIVINLFPYPNIAFRIFYPHLNFYHFSFHIYKLSFISSLSAIQ